MDGRTRALDGDMDGGTRREQKHIGYLDLEVNRWLETVVSRAGLRRIIACENGAGSQHSIYTQSQEKQKDGIRAKGFALTRCYTLTG